MITGEKEQKPERPCYLINVVTGLMGQLIVFESLEVNVLEENLRPFILNP